MSTKPRKCIVRMFTDIIIVGDKCSTQKEKGGINSLNVVSLTRTDIHSMVRK